MLETPPEARLDAIIQRMARSCRTPVALLSLVDRDELFFKARFGFEPRRYPRAGSFCSHAIQHDRFFVVEDALRDARFAALTTWTDSRAV